jgi:chromosome partitioning protein
MPVIVAANTKGGSGKSTSSLILGTTLAKMGATVRILDADPQKTLVSWGAGQSKYRDIVTAPRPGADLSDLIDEISAEYQFVIIDVQGSANQELAAAMSRADLVTIPMRAKTADAEVAANAIGLLSSQQKLFRRTIAHGVVFIATNPVITTKEERHIRESVRELGIPCFQTSLHERTAFSHMFRYKVAIDELSSRETNGLEAALENADNYANEIVTTLRKSRTQEAAA